MKVKQKIKIKGKNPPSFIEGEEDGVIATQIITIPDDYSPIDVSNMLDAEQKLLDETIEITSEEYDG